MTDGNRHARDLVAYLEQACERLDRRQEGRPYGEWWRVPLAVPLTVGLALGLSGCGGETQTRDDSGPAGGMGGAAAGGTGGQVSGTGGSGDDGSCPGPGCHRWGLGADCPGE